MMGWYIFLGVAFVITLATVPLVQWQKLWPIGLISIVTLYIIDTTFIGLGAYSFRNGSSLLSGIPLTYIISYFPGAILLVHFYPQKNKWRFPYILLAAGFFLFMELVMVWIGYFHYIKWNPVRSYLLNVFGFLAIFWMAQWLGLTKKLNELEG